MAKIHYIIDSRKKARIVKDACGKICVIIEEAVTLKENNVIKIHYENFINETNNKKRRIKKDEFLSVFLYGLVTVLLVLIFILLGIGKDLNILTSGYIDNIIGIAALLFAILSIPRVKQWLGKKLIGPSIVNKLWCIALILCAPFYIVIFIKGIGLPLGISNICGVIGIIISILCW